jgi:hypothetical protein
VKSDSASQPVGLLLRLTCTPFELVCWRRAWHAEQRAIKAEAEVLRLEAKLDEMETSEEYDEV